MSLTSARAFLNSLREFGAHVECFALQFFASLSQFFAQFVFCLFYVGAQLVFCVFQFMAQPFEGVVIEEHSRRDGEQRYSENDDIVYVAFPSASSIEEFG
jgi:hypothetical protein